MSTLLLLLAVLTLLPMVLVRTYNNRAVANLEAEVQEHRREASEVEQLLAQREMTIDEITTVLKRADAFEQRTADLARRGPPISASLQAINDALPPRVTIVEIHDQTTQIRLIGRAGSSNLVVEFAQALEDTGQRVVIDQIQQVDATSSDAETIPPSAVTFRLIMEK